MMGVLPIVRQKITGFAIPYNPLNVSLYAETEFKQGQKNVMISILLTMMGVIKFAKQKMAGHAQLEYFLQILQFVLQFMEMD